jgi:ubiquinone/menaquinone biosynthesis C-methylase UbiE
MSTSQAAVNHWPRNRCARAFWGQKDLPPYRRLLADTIAWLEPRPGQRWLDLGCGGGQLTRALWEKSRGRLAAVVALDCAAANETAIAGLRETMTPRADAERVRFLHADFSAGLSALPDAGFDGAVSGLAIQYAESFDEDRGWTTDAYDRLLAEVGRVLRPGGTFVFSVNKPEPSWGLVALCAVPGFFKSWNPLGYLANAARMWRYGAWLKEQARLGRFHYLPMTTVEEKLHAAGFGRVEHTLSFARQAYLIRCRKP